MGNAFMNDQIQAAGQAPSPEVVDATKEQLETIDAAVEGARGMAADGMSALQQAMAGEEVVRMETHFKSSDPVIASLASARMGATQSGLAGRVRIDVDTFCLHPGALIGFKDPVAFVPVNPLTGSRGDIHLLPAFFQQSRDQQAATILHEATHVWAGTHDHAYVDQLSAYQALTVEESLDNADSYAMFALGEFEEARKERRVEDEARERALAMEHGPELWARYQADELVVWETGHTLPDGNVLSSYAVAEGLLDWVMSTRSDLVAEVRAAIERGQEEGPLTCSDGSVIRDDLYSSLYARMFG